MATLSMWSVHWCSTIPLAFGIECLALIDRKKVWYEPIWPLGPLRNSWSLIPRWGRSDAISNMKWKHGGVSHSKPISYWPIISVTGPKDPHRIFPFLTSSTAATHLKLPWCYLWTCQPSAGHILTNRDYSCLLASKDSRPSGLCFVLSDTELRSWPSPIKIQSGPG